MKKNTSTACWCGNLKDGKGTMTIGDQRCQMPFSFGSRFEDGDDTNPEELIAAAHAGCFSMALAHALASAGYDPKHVETVATVSLEPDNGGFAITRVKLETEAKVGGIDRSAFEQYAQETKANCPVSKALAGLDIELDAKLV